MRDNSTSQADLDPNGVGPFSSPGGERRNERNTEPPDATPNLSSTCKVCAHSRGEEFDRKLMLREMTQADVARIVGCHRSSVSRHVRSHVLPTVGQAVSTDAEVGEVDVLEELRNLYRRIKSHLHRAEQGDNWRAIRAFHAEARQDLELLARVLGDLDTRPQVNVLVSAEWTAVRGVLIDALTPYPDARLAVVDRLFELEAGDGHRS